MNEAARKLGTLGGKAGRGAAKRRSQAHYRKISALGVAARTATKSLPDIIDALVQSGIVRASEVKDKTQAELFELATRKNLQIAMGSRKVQAAYRKSFEAVRAARQRGK